MLYEVITPVRGVDIDLVDGGLDQGLLDLAGVDPVAELDLRVDFKFDSTFVVISDTCNPARIHDILHQCPRHGGGQSFGLTATGTG